jgi:hypothetical protein
MEHMGLRSLCSQNYHVYLARDGSTEIQGNEEVDSRSLLLKVLCVLTFGLLFRQKTSDRRVDARAEVQGSEKSDTRPLIIKVLSYTTLGIFSGRRTRIGVLRSLANTQVGVVMPRQLEANGLRSQPISDFRMAVLGCKSFKVPNTSWGFEGGKSQVTNLVYRIDRRGGPGILPSI